MSAKLRTIGLLALTALPISAGLARLAEQTTGAPAMDPTMGSLHMPVPLALHIFTASAFLILGAFQFLPALRRKGWHRKAGRVAVVMGLLSAGSGYVMSLILPVDPTSGPLLVPLRLFFSAAWFAALVLGLIAAHRRNFSAHGAWMVRGYAIGAATGLQSLALIPWFLLFGVPTGLPSDLVMLAGWIIAVAFGEYRIRLAWARARGPAV